MTMFQWIRNRVKNAILAGINDAMEVLEGQAKCVPDDQEKLLSERVTILIDEPKKKRAS